jgi:hypothetical protein
MVYVAYFAIGSFSVIFGCAALATLVRDYLKGTDEDT